MQRIMPFMKRHLTSDALIAYAEGQADAVTAGQVREHLESGCARCARELAVWSRIMTALEADQATAPPEAVRQRAFTLFDQIRPVSRGRKRILAIPLFDSRLQGAAAGVRNLGKSSYSLVFGAGEVNISLLFAWEKDRWQARGQVLSEPAPEVGWKVSCTSPSGRIETEADAVGEFQLNALEPGLCELTVLDAEIEIILPRIELTGP